MQQKINDLTKQLTTKAPILKEPVVNPVNKLLQKELDMCKNTVNAQLKTIQRIENNKPDEIMVKKAVIYDQIYKLRHKKGGWNPDMIQDITACNILLEIDECLTIDLPKK